MKSRNPRLCGYLLSRSFIFHLSFLPLLFCARCNDDLLHFIADPLPELEDFDFTDSDFAAFMKDPDDSAGDGDGRPSCSCVPRLFREC